MCDTEKTAAEEAAADVEEAEVETDPEDAEDKEE
jgi:hypothetical protein